MIVNAERPLTAASEALQFKLSGVLGWDVVLSDQMTADLHAIEQEAALRAEATRDEGLREAAEALADATDHYLDTGRSPGAWATDRTRLWQAAKDVRAALASSPEPVPSEDA